MTGSDEAGGTAVYDGDCDICRVWVNYVRERDKRGLLKSVPFQSANLERIVPGLDRESARQSLWFVDNAGRRYRGARAAFEVLRRLPGAWGIVGAIMSFPALSAAAEPFYRLFARHRGRISRLRSAQNSASRDPV